MAPAKILDQFSRQQKQLEIKGGVLNGAPLTAVGVQQLAQLPSREELLAQVLRGLQGPLYGLVGVLSCPRGRWCTCWMCSGGSGRRRKVAVRPTAGGLSLWDGVLNEVERRPG